MRADDVLDRLGDQLQPRDLIGRDLPGAEVEGDGVHVDPPHAVAQRHIVADLVERVGPLDRHQRRRRQGLVDERLGRHRGIDDVLILRDADDRHRQVEEDRLAARTAVVDQDELAAVAVAAEAPHQPAIVVGDGDDLVAVRPGEDRVHAVVAPFAATLLELEEALAFVVAHEGLAAFAHDLPVIGLLDDDPAAGFGALMPLGAQILHVAEGGPACGLSGLLAHRGDALEGLDRLAGVLLAGALHRLPADDLLAHARWLVSAGRCSAPAARR